MKSTQFATETDSVKVIFTGTGTSQGIPVIGCQCPVCTSSDERDNRLRTSVYVELDNGYHLSIDSGPDFRQQMLRAGIRELHGILFTHEHKDHVAGLDDIRSFNFLMRRDIDIMASAAVEKALRREFYYIFDEHPYSGVPSVNMIPIDDRPFQYFGQTIIPIQVMHYKMPVLGFRINDFTYVTDANFIADAEKEKMKNSKVLVLNALRKEPHISHFNLQEALNLVEELQPEQAYFTHLSHMMGKHEHISAELPDNVALAYDGLTIEV